MKLILLALISLAILLAGPSARASIAYGSINNFDTVNDTGHECHGFEIEIEDCRSTDITYTYNYNHYGVPNITQDDTDPAHPKCRIRWESKKNADGSWAAYTAIPSGPINPTNGHMFTNPNVNFGGEHFGVGYRVSVGAVLYNWLIDNGGGTLVRGGAVEVSTPTFTYFPPVGNAPAQVQAVIVPPVPPAPPPKEFGKAVWMKEIKTTTHNNNEIKLRELVSDDPGDPNDKNWANGEPDEVEVEWRILQKKTSAADGGPNNEVAAAPEQLPNGNEVVTRRYEFYKYKGPLDAESGEAMADAVGADGLHGTGMRTYNDHLVGGEWVTATNDMATFEVVGDYTGAQMAALDVDAPVGLIDHVSEGTINTAYADRTVVIEGALPFSAVQEGILPSGMTFDETTGVLAGTPTASGNFQFKVTASDGINPDVSKNYTLTIAAAGAPPPPASLLDTVASPVDAGTTTGDGSYAVDAEATVTATANDGYVFLNWTDNGAVVSSNSTYTIVMDVNHSLTANFVAAGVIRTITTSAAPVAGGSTSGDASVNDGDSVTVVATPNGGYNFVNWTENAVILSSAASYTFAATADRTLVANFSNTPTYSITTSAVPTAGGTTSGDATVASGTSVTVTAAPNAGYNFVNWTQGGAEVSVSASYTFTAAANRGLVANFAAIGVNRTITTSASPVAGGTTTGAGGYADGASVTVTATASPGYKFSKWKEGSTTASSTATYTFTASADRTLVASFTVSYSITASAFPANGGSTEMDSSSYKPGDTAQARATANAGYQFVNWTENGIEVSTAAIYSFPATGNRVLEANFIPVGGVIIGTSAAPSAGGTTSGGGGFAIGDSVTVSATANVSYAFVNWTDGVSVVSNSPSYTFLAAANRTLVANFAPGYSISANVFPPLAGTVGGGGLVIPGDSTTLTVAGNAGYTFVHWKDNFGAIVSADPSYTFTPTASGVFTANFTAPIAAISFDFDTGTPLLTVDTLSPIDQSKAGIMASFDSPDPDAFVVKTEASTARTLSNFSRNFLESVLDGTSLEIWLDQPVTGVSFDFATVEAVDVPVGSTVQLTAYDNSTGSPVVVGTAIAHGSVVPGDSMPVGNLSFNTADGTFDQIIVQLVDPASGAARFLVDNFAISPGGSTGGTILLANPNWNITLSDFGYSDFLLDNTPGFEGREYLSGEWGSAVSYSRNGTPQAPTWFEPNFLYPDWQTNSNFSVVTGIHLVGLNLDGLPIAESVIGNNDLEITLRFEMVDTVVGTPMGITPASAASAPVSVDSNRYVMNQSFTVKNVSGEPITNLSLYQLLHGFISQHGQYDNRLYPGKLGEYQFDVTMAGVDESAAGTDSSTIGLEDLIGFHARQAPTAFEIGHYGIEGNGIDDHSLGKPSDGVHLSIEDNWENSPYSGREGRDSFAPVDRWIAGGQRWALGALAAGQSVSMDIVLSLLTGTKVVITGGGSSGTGGGGSCNGGSSHVGGVDFEFEDIDQEGTFFGAYSEADDNELTEREDDGEFALPSFDTPSGTRRQVWKLNYSGTHTGNIKLKFAYNPALLPAGYDENQLVIYHFRNGAWEKLACRVDVANKVIEATTPSLSPFMLGVNDVVVKPDVQVSSTTPGNLDVSWPDTFTGWQLQESADLSTWTSSTLPVVNDAGTNRVTVPVRAGVKFFRLLKP